MNEFVSRNWHTSPLAGARIWLSGALPEPESTSIAERESILTFVKSFARLVFARGGHIIHGSHPSFTPSLLEEAARHQSIGGKRDCLTLAVSRYWSKNPNQIPIAEWRRIALVYETPEVPGEDSRHASLDLLRKWISARSDSIVQVGGRWWHESRQKAGTPIELGMAIERGLPCFLLGGLGGATATYLRNHPEILRSLKNGLDEASNAELCTSSSLEALAPRVCSHLELLPLVRGRGSDGSSFRVLALDGGGLKGAFTAAALASWEQTTKLRVVDHFDLIAGTSTGGILAIGLGLGLSATQILDFYRKRGPVIFPVTTLRSKFRHSFRHVWSPKYSQETLLAELRGAYYGTGNPRLLKESLCRLLIPAYHAIAGASHVFRTPHHPELVADANTEAAYAALATSAAPTFFSAAQLSNMVSKSEYFDGGVWANTPALAAVVEAVCFLKVPIERIDLLSVGTTDEPFTVREQTRAGIVGWAWKKKIVDLLMNVQQEAAIKLAQNLVTEPKLFRVNHVTVPGTYKLDSPQEIEELASLGERRALLPEVLSQIRSRFLNGIVVNAWDKYA